MIEPSELEQKLRAAFPGAVRLEVEDLTGTKDHYKAVIIASEFNGKSRIEQHQLFEAGGDTHSAGEGLKRSIVFILLEVLPWQCQLELLERP